ncbi:MAG: putative epoxide hydrolase [Aeromicrobium sp.]|nr:putative epoxide hydrolase [Aeromicrobium sp.]
MKIEPFTIAVPQSEIDDLTARLLLTRFPDDVNDDHWGWGTDATFLRRAIEYWRDGFDWRAQEARMNAFPHFLAHTGDADINFILV